MTKVNPENMKELYDTLWNIFCKKNHDYGNSFELSLDKHGLVAGIVRMEDKMNRLSTLAQGDKDAQIASESLVDTLMDLSNYAAMSACWLMHKDDYDIFARGISDSIVTTMDKEEFEEVENLFHLSSFEGHQEKVNERTYYDSDEEIIKNWGLVGDSLNDIKTIRSRTTGQYFTEDDNPELFRKICPVLKEYHSKDKFERQLESLSKQVTSEINRREDIVKEINEHPLLTEPKGLENGYFIRQHTNVGNSDRYTLAFSPESTVKTTLGEELPYVIECYSNDHDGMTGWTIHVFYSREDMVSALNYDLKVCNEKGSKQFIDSIGELKIRALTFETKNTRPVCDAWSETFGYTFTRNMNSNDIFSKGYFDIEQGLKTFGPVFISEKTGALVIKGVVREAHGDRNHNFIWFSDTKEVLLELKNTVPKFNRHGIIYGINSENVNNGENYDFSPLYQDMEDKILSKFHSWDGSELKNLAFFNEDEELKSEITEKKMQIPNDLVAEKPKNTVGTGEISIFSDMESGSLSSKSGKIGLDLTGGKLYSGGLEQISGKN